MFCKRPPTATVEDLLGQPAVNAILNPPMLPVPWHGKRATIAGVAIVTGIGVFALHRNDASFLAILVTAAVVALIAGKPWIDHIRDRYLNRHELSRADLAKLESNAVKKRNIHALEEYRRQIGYGTLKAYAVSPSGGATPLAGKDLACFVADHGRALLVSENHNDWINVRARPLPMGAIWIDLGGATARTQLTAKTLIDEADEQRYQQRVDWIRERAIERGQSTGVLVSGLAIITALRDPKVKGQAFSKTLPTIRTVLTGNASSDSVITKMNSGNYAEFETALQALPLEDLP